MPGMQAIGEYGDGFKSGDPSGYDPLQLAREYAKKGISLVSFDRLHRGLATQEAHRSSSWLANPLYPATPTLPTSTARSRASPRPS